jgi:serine/threonine-protein kinase
MATEPDSFDDLIDAIAEGAAIDWPRLEAAGHFGVKELQAAKAIAGMRDSSECLATNGADASHGAERPGFERLAVIGRGAYGVVWRARDRVLGRDVALKVLENDGSLTPAQRSRFLREARSLAACEHENIVRIHSVEECDGHLELCLELLDGVSLETLVREGGPLSAEEAARIGSDLCHALAAMHARGLFHRDVKPANVMRVRGGRIVLLDFGLAHASDPTARRGVAAGGTPLFMAPELLNGATDFDARVDLYSLGVTLYWLVTATWPYEAASRDELVEKMERGPPIPLIDRRSDLPVPFVELVSRALSRDRGDRFASAGEMDEALRSIAPARPSRPSWPTRRTLVGVVAAALVLFAATLLIEGWRSRPVRAEVAFDRIGRVDGKDQRVPLPREAAVSVGDQLIARLTLDRAAYVYVFNADQADHFFAVFPLRGSTLHNPLSAGASDLPGPDVGGGGLSTWTLDSAGKEETFLFFIAREPSPELQAMWEKCRKPSEPGGPSDGQNMREVVRGAGTTGHFAAALADGSNRKFVDELKQFADNHSVLGGVTVLQATFTNSDH